MIYLLLDVMYFSNKSGASVESFPNAFAIPIGLVKLVQGLWLLDHHDHQVDARTCTYTGQTIEGYNKSHYGILYIWKLAFSKDCVWFVMGPCMWNF